MHRRRSRKREGRKRGKKSIVFKNAFVLKWLWTMAHACARWHARAMRTASHSSSLACSLAPSFSLSLSLLRSLARSLPRLLAHACSLARSLPLLLSPLLARSCSLARSLSCSLPCSLALRDYSSPSFPFLATRRPATMQPALVMEGTAGRSDTAFAHRG